MYRPKSRPVANKKVRQFFVLFFFAALGFFRPSFIGQVDMLSRYLFEAVGLILVFYSFSSPYKNLKLNVMAFIGFSLLMLSMFTSIAMAWKFNGQSLSQGFTSTLPYMFSYGSLILLFRLKINPSYLEKIIKYFAIAAMCIMVLNFLTYPTALFGSAQIAEARGGVLRVRVPGIMTIAFFLLYSINKYTLSKDSKHLKWIAACSLFIIMSLTRQLILLCLVFGVLTYFRNAKLTSKLTFITLALCIGVFVLPQISVFQNLFNYTNQQLNDDGEDNIRLIAWEYYTKEKQVDPSNYIWGTGAPNSNSRYGKDFFDETTELKVFIVDIGFGGFFYLFGALGVVGIGLLLISSLFFKSLLVYTYVKFFVIINLLMSFTSGVILNRSDVVLLMISIYLLSYKYENRNRNFKLQQSN